VPLPPDVIVIEGDKFEELKDRPTSNAKPFERQTDFVPENEIMAEAPIAPTLDPTGALLEESAPLSGRTRKSSGRCS
jgi:hypothetical protein